MGGCCSKCGKYLPGEREQPGTDNAKLTKLQHKQSFSATPSKVNGAGEGADQAATPILETGDTRQETVSYTRSHNAAF